MRHPTEGVLRRLLDEPAGVGTLDRQHVADCPQCLADLTAAREDAALIGAALADDDDRDVDVDAAWQRLSTSTTAPVRAITTAPRRRAGALVRRPAVAALAVAVVLTGAGTAAAGGWLQIFQTQEIAPVSITTRDLLALPDLSEYGELALTSNPRVHEVSDIATAEKETGLDVPEVAELPKGIGDARIIQVGGKASATFTFSAERAAQAAADAGEPLPPVPPGLDGAQVRLVAGPGVAQIWASSSGAPGLIVGRAGSPSAFSSGVPFETVRDYLLSLPGLPSGLASQLRTFADGATLPLPVPADQVTTSSAEVDGVPATVLQMRNGTLAAVVWVEEGIVTVVAGSLDDGEVLEVARDLE